MDHLIISCHDLHCTHTSIQGIAAIQPPPNMLGAVGVHDEEDAEADAIAMATALSLSEMVQGQTNGSFDGLVSTP